MSGLVELITQNRSRPDGWPGRFFSFQLKDVGCVEGSLSVVTIAL